MNGLANICQSNVSVECENNLNCTAEKPYCAEHGICVGNPYFDNFHDLQLSYYQLRYVIN